MHHRSLVTAACAALALAACSSGGGGSTAPVGGGLPPAYGGGQCNPGTAVQLANPLPNQSGVNPNLGSITIVANGSNNALYSSYQSWQIVLQDTYGDQPIFGSPFQLVPDPNGPHPFASDFYYQSSLNGQLLPAGYNWNVFLGNVATGCGTNVIGTFST